MLDIGWSELVVIGVVALVVVGPKELPSLLRTIGQWVGKARRMAAEFQGQLNDAIREAELDDVKKSVEDLRSLSPTRLVTDHFTAIGNEIDSVGRSAEAEIAGIKAAAPPHASPGEAGSALAGFTEASETTPVSSQDVESLIRAAGTPVPDLPPPVFETAGPTEAPVAAEVAATEAAPEKKADPA